jgi:hypothetical protein
MTWLWRICFSGLWLLPAWCANVKGTVVLTDSRDPGVRRNKDFRDVVVWLEPWPATLRAALPAALPHDGRKTSISLRTYWPSRWAPPWTFPNKDPIFHNVFSNYNGQIFDLSLYKPNTSRDVAFKRPASCACFATFIRP